MQACFYDLDAPKKPVNLNANSDLIRTAKSVDLNLSQIFEEAVHAVVKKRLELKWLEQNRGAIDAYNFHIEEHGVFAAGKRRF